MEDWTIMLRDKVIKHFSLSEGEVVSIGRGQDCNITIDNTAISRQHVSLALNGGIFLVSDLGSTNGTFVNGKRVSQDEPVSENDNIEFGKFTLSISQEDENNKVASSVSADTLDMDDETVFVSKKRVPTSPIKRFKPRNAGPHLKVLQGNGSPTELALEGRNSIKIGKDSSCDLILSGWLIAQAQCYIIKRDKGYYVVPQKSWAGTFINDTKISSEHILRAGDIIKIRRLIIRFE